MKHLHTLEGITILIWTIASIKNHLSKKLNELLDDTDRLPLYPKNKLKLFRYYVLSKLTWDFTVANLSATWVKENLDNVASRFLRRWLEIPVCGTLDICLLSKEDVWP